MNTTELIGLVVEKLYGGLTRGPHIPITPSRKLMSDNISYTEKRNSALLKYNAAEPVSLEDLLLIAKIDQEVWTVKKYKVNAWQMGRKAKTVDLEFYDGVMSGTVEDSGKLHKEYLYQMTVELERACPLPAVPTLTPVQVGAPVVPPRAVATRAENSARVIFVTDPHFGFTTPAFGKAQPFQHRQFLSDLMSISSSIRPDVVIWGGDTLDLPDFSSFQSDPTIINKTQMAAIEAAWVISAFGQTAKRQVVLEGNHDVRLQKAINKNLAAAYDLRPADNLTGPSLLSVSRLLGVADDPSIEWVGGYPDSRYTIGEVIFEHGSVARKGSGATVAALARERIHSTFFGHIHRYERIQKKVFGKNESIFIGTPGCACSREILPGASETANWTNGAFLITITDGLVTSVEDIIHDRAETTFRGLKHTSVNYLGRMKSDLGEEIGGFF